MIQNLLTYAPLIVAVFIGICFLILAVRSYMVRKGTRTNELDAHTIGLLAFGNGFLAIFGSLLLFAFTRSFVILFALFLSGILLFLIGELRLRALIISGKESFFALLIMMFGAITSIFVFPLLIHMYEPFIAIYSFVSLACILLQVMLISSWKSRRRSEKASSISEEQLNE